VRLDDRVGRLAQMVRRRWSLRIEKARQRGRNARSFEWALLNVKTLGYELARTIASTNLRPPPSAPPAAALVSKMCTQSDMESAWFAFWCAELGITPFYHRKVWEHCYVAQALMSAGMMAPGRRGLGFGCGDEPLASLFAKYGCEILATDLPPTAAQARHWRAIGQHASGAGAARQERICPDRAKLAKIGFRSLDMKRIPDDLAGTFDFCWSCCALEHLGSIANGAAFIANSLRTLKPRGLAVHTTEYNLDDAGGTLDRGGTVLFQRKHIEAIARRLRADGHRVAELDFDPGDGLLDRFVDLPPWKPGEPASPLHLKLSVFGYRCTSYGIIVERAG